MNLPKLLLNNDLTNKLVEFCNNKGARNYLTQFEEIFKKGLEIECEKKDCLDTIPVVELEPIMELIKEEPISTVDEAISLLDSFLKEYPEYVGDVTDYLLTNYSYSTLDETIQPLVDEKLEEFEKIKVNDVIVVTSEETKPKKPAAKKQPSPKKGITSKIKK
jgi:lipopolysaccharide biosynthesis regulator YciM